jgi:hypothetical protein
MILSVVKNIANARFYLMTFLKPTTHEQTKRIKKNDYFNLEMLLLTS